MRNLFSIQGIILLRWTLMKKMENQTNEYKDDQQEFKEERKTIPVIEEVATITKQTVDTGSLHVVKSVENVREKLSTILTSSDYEVKRFPREQFVNTAPEAVRYEDDKIIIPVLE